MQCRKNINALFSNPLLKSMKQYELAYRGIGGVSQEKVVSNGSLVKKVEKGVGDMSMEKEKEVVEKKEVNKKYGNSMEMSNKKYGNEEGGVACNSFDEKVEGIIIRGLKRKRGELYESVKMMVERMVEKKMN